MKGEPQGASCDDGTGSDRLQRKAWMHQARLALPDRAQGWALQQLQGPRALLHPRAPSLRERGRLITRPPSQEAASRYALLTSPGSQGAPSPDAQGTLGLLRSCGLGKLLIIAHAGPEAGLHLPAIESVSATQGSLGGHNAGAFLYGLLRSCAPHVQATPNSSQKAHTPPASGRQTVLSAVSQLPSDQIMHSSMYGSLLG